VRCEVGQASTRLHEVTWQQTKMFTVLQKSCLGFMRVSLQKQIDLSLRRLLFETRQLHVGFVVNKVAKGRVIFPGTSVSPCPYHFHQSHTHIFIYHQSHTLIYSSLPISHTHIFISTNLTHSYIHFHQSHTLIYSFPPISHTHIFISTNLTHSCIHLSPMLHKAIYSGVK
jgi:hypothetical protein